MNLTITQRGLVLLLLPLLFELGFVVLVAGLQKDLATAQHWAAHSKDVIAQTHEIHSVVADAHAAVRGYVIARDPAFADPFRRADRELPGELDRLAGLVGDNPDQADRARAVRAAAVAALAWQAETVRLVDGGRGDEAAARIRSGQGQDLMAEFRRASETFLKEEDLLDRARVAALGRAREEQHGVFLAGGTLVVVTILVLAIAFRRGIGRRFAALTDTARRLAAGEPLLPPLSGKDELAGLDRAFRDMTAGLTRAADEIRDLYDNAPCGYHSVDPDGVLVAINRTELRWLGYAAAEVVGRGRFVDLVAPASRETYRATFARVRAEGGRPTSNSTSPAGTGPPSPSSSTPPPSAARTAATSAAGPRSPT